MKNIIYFLLVSFFILIGCKKDVEQPEFTFEFSSNIKEVLPEYGVNDETKIDIDFVTSYEFSSLKHNVMVLTDKQGTFFFGNDEINQNIEVPIINNQISFKYRGLEKGEHKLRFIFTNERGYKEEKTLQVNYKEFGFSHTYEDKQTDTYQGDLAIYPMKIISSIKNVEYDIKFNTYEGIVYMDGVPVELGKYYNIKNIDNFEVGLKTNKQGLGKLTYSIKNKTLSRDYEIQQNINKRQIYFESINLSKVDILPTDEIIITAIIKKIPYVSNDLQYKTWISSYSSNTDNGGIETTNNTYVNYYLSNNGNFQINFRGLKTGKYTYNIQLKDEFGNESEIKSFDINVGEHVQFLNIENTQAVLNFSLWKFRHAGATRYNWRFLGAELHNIEGVSSPKKITKIRCEVSFKLSNYKSFVYEKNINRNHFNYTVEQYQDYADYDWINEGVEMITEAKMKIFLYTEDGRSIFVEKQVTTRVVPR